MPTTTGFGSITEKSRKTHHTLQLHLSIDIIQASRCSALAAAAEHLRDSITIVICEEDKDFLAGAIYSDSPNFCHSRKKIAANKCVKICQLPHKNLTNSQQSLP